MADEDSWAGPPLQVSDPAMLRALAHPMRQRIMFELAARNHARAADLARWLGEPANALSFHLRTLAKAGLIRELPEHARDKRDRVWALVSQGGLRVDGDAADPAFSAFVAERVDWLRRLTAGEFDDDTSLSTGSFGGALLTKAEAEQLERAVTALLWQWRKDGAARAEQNPDDPDRIYHAYIFAIGRDIPRDGRDGRAAPEVPPGPPAPTS